MRAPATPNRPASSHRREREGHSWRRTMRSDDQWPSCGEHTLEDPGPGRRTRHSDAEKKRWSGRPTAAHARRRTGRESNSPAGLDGR